MENVRIETLVTGNENLVEKGIFDRRKDTGRGGIDGNTANYFWREGQWNKITREPEILTRKLRNKNIKMKNGNGNKQNILKISHWNIGAKQWPKKVEEMELLVQETEPDLLFVSEANLLKNTPNHEKFVDGYDIIEPDTVDKYGYARIILLAKKGLNIHVLHEYMNEDLACIWVRVGNKTKKPTHVGGGYIGNTNTSFRGNPTSQKLRELKGKDGTILLANGS